MSSAPKAKHFGRTFSFLARRTEKDIKVAANQQIEIYLSNRNRATLTFPSISVATISNPHFSV